MITFTGNASPTSVEEKCYMAGKTVICNQVPASLQVEGLKNQTAIIEINGSQMSSNPLLNPLFLAFASLALLLTMYGFGQSDEVSRWLANKETVSMLLFLTSLAYGALENYNVLPGNVRGLLILFVPLLTFSLFLWSMIAGEKAWSRMASLSLFLGTFGLLVVVLSAGA